MCALGETIAELMYCCSSWLPRGKHHHNDAPQQRLAKIVSQQSQHGEHPKLRTFHGLSNRRGQLREIDRMVKQTTQHDQIFFYCKYQALATQGSMFSSAND
jgi:hypothetical protein